MVGENSANWMDGRNQTNYTCEYCSKEFIAGKCEDRKYCSSECGHKDSAGKTRPKTGGRIKLTCDWCKVEFERLKCNVPDRYNNRFCSNDCQYAWMSENLSGENNWKWISDRTKLKNYGTNKIRCSSRAMKWRKEIFERDDYTCQLCGQYGGTLNGHHIKPFCKYPDMVFDLENGITLCYDCHKEVTWGDNNYENLFDMMVNGFEC